MIERPQIWGVVPAAGVGRRMGSEIPKQYLPLMGRPVLDHTLEKLLSCPSISGVCVALSPDDGWWSSCSSASDPRILRATGGSERCYSVLNALGRLKKEAAASDWVLVHDAVRPCLRRSDIEKMIGALGEHDVGGILGIPLQDTVKRVGMSRRIKETLPRAQLWRAFTPQMFRLGTLSTALANAIESGNLVTDESSAMEFAGHAPVLVEGQPDNIKITQPDDLTLAAFYLSRQQG